MYFGRRCENLTKILQKFVEEFSKLGARTSILWLLESNQLGYFSQSSPPRTRLGELTAHPQTP